jgi:hypothetical protein
MTKIESFLKKAMGEDGFENLFKHSILKLNTNTTVSDAELFNALQVVPATVLAFLKKVLIPMKEGDNQRIKLPLEGDPVMDVTKLGPDVYTGQIYQQGKILSEFKYRPLPGVGLVLLTTFELYDPAKFGSKVASDDDKRLIANKVEEEVNKHNNVVMDKEKEILPLKSFLDKKSSKIEKKEYTIVNLTKNDSVNCPDCDQQILGKGMFTHCVCSGSDRSKKVWIKKSENGVKVSFSRGFDPENIQMILDALRNKRS